MITNDIFNHMQDDLLTLSEVAERLRLSKLTVWRYVKEGRLPAYKIGRDLRIKSSELETYIESKRVRRSPQ
jgi:putative molybdopterin biosynthesis protein